MEDKQNAANEIKALVEKLNNAISEASKLGLEVTPELNKGCGGFLDIKIREVKLF